MGISIVKMNGKEYLQIKDHMNLLVSDIIAYRTQHYRYVLCYKDEQMKERVMGKACNAHGRDDK
jgi:hypothetical protein